MLAFIRPLITVPTWLPSRRTGATENPGSATAGTHKARLRYPIGTGQAEGRVFTDAVPHR